MSAYFDFIRFRNGFLAFPILRSDWVSHSSSCLSNYSGMPLNSNHLIGYCWKDTSKRKQQNIDYLGTVRSEQSERMSCSCAGHAHWPQRTSIRTGLRAHYLRLSQKYYIFSLPRSGNVLLVWAFDDTVRPKRPLRMQTFPWIVAAACWMNL